MARESILEKMASGQRPEAGDGSEHRSVLGKKAVGRGGVIGAE